VNPATSVPSRSKNAPTCGPCGLPSTSASDPGTRDPGEQRLAETALQRARLRLERVAPGPERLGTAPTARQQELADRYVTAFVDADMATLTRLLADEVVLEMPPYPQWFQGRVTVARFLTKRPLARDSRWRAIPVTANGQPAIGAYRIEDDGRHHARMIQLFHASENGLTWIPAFHDQKLFPLFGLPLIYPG